MLFSIIVPVYNVEKYLKRCVDSIINQTFKDIEIILVDDGSTDASPNICDAYKEIDSRVIVIHKENGGLSDARNRGLEIAKGEYIVFVDSDDFIFADSCERLSKYTSKNYDIIIGDAVVVGGIRDVVHAQNTFDKEMSGKEFLKESLLQNKMPMAAVVNVYRRAFLLTDQLNFKFGVLHEDEHFTPRVFLKAQSVIYTGICFYQYIIHAGTITTKQDKRKNARDLYSTCLELEGLYKNLSDKSLKDMLLNSLVDKYLSMFQLGRLYQYGKEYIHKKFVWRNSKKLKTRLKASLFIFSPKLYFKINKKLKQKVSV